MLPDPSSLSRLGVILAVLLQLVGLLDRGDQLVWRWIRRWRRR